MSGLSSYRLPSLFKNMAWKSKREKKKTWLRLESRSLVRSKVQPRGTEAEGQKRSTNTPHAHDLILATENLIGLGKRGKVSSRLGQGAIVYPGNRSNGHRTVASCKRYLVFISLAGWKRALRVVRKHTIHTTEAKAFPHFPENYIILTFIRGNES